MCIKKILIFLSKSQISVVRSIKGLPVRIRSAHSTDSFGIVDGHRFDMSPYRGVVEFNMKGRHHETGEGLRQ